MNTYAGGSLTSTEAALLASKIIRGRPERTTRPCPSRSQIFAYHMRQLRFAFQNTKGDSPACRATESLFQAVIKNCALLEVIDHQKWNAVAFLLRLSRYHQHWISSPSSWSPQDLSKLPSCNPEKTLPNNDRVLFDQLRSLIRHLFGKYPLPGFWDSVWFQSGKIDFQWMDWYVELSAGKSFRSLKGLPIRLNKKAAHLSTQAPDDLQVPQAFRWAQLRAQGISDLTCKTIVKHHCATDFGNDHLWLPLFRLLPSGLEENQTLQLCTYVHLRIHEYSAAPLYHVKGKTLKSLTREMDDFYQNHPEYLLPRNTKQRRTKRRQKILRWENQSKYKEWCETDIYDGEDYSIGEICKSFQLISEGRKMNHCVGTYVRQCMNGESSIWSLRSRYDGQWKTHVTIEVNPHTDTIVQAQSYQNSEPTAEDWQRISKWARINRITFASWL